MHVYLVVDGDGKYRQGWSHKILIPTAEDLMLIALLDASTENGEDVSVSTPDWAKYRLPSKHEGVFEMKRIVRVSSSGELRTHYWIPGSGTYEGERDC